MEASSSGTFTLVNLKKKSTCKWNGSIKPTKNKTYKVRLNLHINNARMAVDVDVSMNSDATVNVLGDMTTTQGKNTIKKQIDLKHYKMNTKMLPQHNQR
jgi:hypothetical protein